MANCPQFLNTIQGCFVVDNACLTFGHAHTFSWTSYTLYECIGTHQNLLTKALTKADFNYPQNSQGISGQGENMNDLQNYILRHTLS